MVSIIFGILFIALTLYAVLPISWGLQWTEEFIIAVKGGLPIFFAFVGLLCILVGLLVIKDKLESAREEKKIKSSSLDSNDANLDKGS